MVTPFNVEGCFPAHFFTIVKACPSLEYDFSSGHFLGEEDFLEDVPPMDD